nr:MAG: polyprotein [Myna hepatovirus]
MALKKILGEVGGILGLNDPGVEEQQMQSDRVTIGGSIGFTTVDQASVSVGVSGHRQDEQLRSAVDIVGGKESQGERFYLVGSYEWNNTHDYLGLVGTLNLDIVKLLASVDHAVSGLILYHRYGRFGLDIIVQINPTQFQQGGIIVALMPGTHEHISFAAIPIFPHVKLNCNINNMGRIKVPFVHTRGMHDFHDPLYVPWTLQARVLAKLEQGDGANTSCTVNVLARFTDLELHGLTPLTTVIESQMFRPDRGSLMRQEVRISSTSNVVNLSNRQDARAKVSFALDNESFDPEPSVAGGLEVSNFRSWTEVPTIIGHFPYNAAFSAGTRMWTVPVDPYLFLTKVGTGAHPSALASVAQMYGFWRGDIVYHFEVFPSRFHSGRLLVVFIPGNEKTDVSSVTMLRATNGYCAIMDINGTASTLVFRVPYVCDVPYRTNTYTTVNTPKGVYSSTGKISVYAYTKLRCPSTVAQHVWVVVYASGANIEFYAPIYHAMKAGDEHGEPNTLFAMTGGFETGPQVQQQVLEPRSINDKPETTPPVGAVTTLEDPALAMKKPETFPEMAPGLPLHGVDHMEMRVFMGRAQYYTHYTFSKNQHVYSFPIKLNIVQEQPNIVNSFPGTLRWFFSLFQLYKGALDVTVVISGAHDVDGAIWFTPKSLHHETWWQESAASLTATWKAALGVIRFNSRRTGNIQVRIPWYVDTMAVSGNVSFEPDTEIGTLSIQISNYSQADEYISFSLYISMTDESRFYFPRAPFNNARIQGSATTDIHAEQPVEDERSLAFNNSRSLESAPYKPLRLEVGAWRLRYARDELGRKKQTKLSSKSLENLLAQDGVEFEDGTLVQKKSGGYVLRGCYYAGKVYYADSVPKGTRMLPVVKYGQFVSTTDCHNWTSRHKKFDVGIIRMWSMCDHHQVLFNFKSFVEDGLSVGEYQMLQQQMNGKLAHIFAIMRPVTVSILDSIVGEESSTKKDVEHLLNECLNTLEGVRNASMKLASAISKKRSALVCRSILGLTKIALSLYVCQKTNWRGRVAMPLLAGVLLDGGMMSVDLVEIVRESLSTVLSSIGGEDLETQSMSWLRDVVAGIAIFKAAKDAIGWLVNKVEGWYQRKYGKKKAIFDLLQEQETQLEGLIADADDFCVSNIAENTKAAQWQQGVDLLGKLRTAQSLMNSDNDTRKHLGIIRDSISRVHNKIKQLGTINQSVTVRPEPVVIYLAGDRGGGKSLLSMCIAVKICKYMGVDYTENIYTKPVGSEYWDGYANQLVCIIDDIGQRSDDSDWMDFCQLVSGCPMRLNMAAVEEKGKHFTSPFIICTSNLLEPMPKTVYVADAILRRLHFRFRIKPKPEYERSVSATSVKSGILNVEKAKEDGKMADMSCLIIESTHGKHTADEIVGYACQTFARRKTNMSEFLDLWAQGSDLCSIFGDREEKRGVLCKMYMMIHDNPLTIMGMVFSVLGVVGTMYGLFKAYKHFTKVESEGAYDRTPKPTHVVRLHLQEQNSMSVLEISNLIRKNLVRFGVGSNEEDVQWLLNGLGVKEDWFLVPSHAYKFDNEDKEFFFIEKGNTFYCIPREKVEVLSLECGFGDVVLMRFPGIQPFRDITAHFVSKEDVMKCNNKMATLCTVNAGIFAMISEGVVKYEEAVEYNHRTIDGKQTMLHVTGVWRGKGEASPGSCGGALVSSNNKLQNPIIGIHVAGGKSGLISKVVYREMFELIDGKHLEAQRITKCEFVSQRLQVGSKTRFRMSPLFDAVKNEINFPAAMPYNNKNEIDPIAVMLDKYNCPIYGEPKDFSEARDYVCCKLAAICEDVDHRVLTPIEAIEGIEGLDGLDMKTSPGLPYVLHGLRKSDLIKVEKGDLEMHPMLFSYWSRSMDALEKGYDLDCVFATCAKDELRPEEKVVASQTRAIESAPLHFTILVRQVWGTVLGCLQSSPGWHSGIAVGMDPDSDWDPMFKSAVRFADVGLDLDFKNFDASVSPFMLRNACVIMSILSGTSLDMGEVIFRTICYSRHMIGNMIYQVRGSMPSGTPCTSVLNSIINQMMTYYVLVEVTHSTYALVHETFKVLCYGDDIVILVRRGQELPEDFCHKITIGYARMGMTVTGSDKREVRIKPVLELEFLKRTVSIQDGTFYPRMRDKTIWSMVAWCRTNAEFEDNLLTACWLKFLQSDEEGQRFLEWLRTKIKFFKLDVRLEPRGYFLVRKRDLDHTREFDRALVFDIYG